MAAPRITYEQPQPWEQQQGSLCDRVVKVSHDARRVYAQQEALLPTLIHDHAADPAVGEHLQEVGRRVLILEEHAKKPDKTAARLAAQQDAGKRVIPSRFAEIQDDVDNLGDENVHDARASAYMDGRIEIMLMDQEWDTRSWNAAKIQVAVQTLCDEVENSAILERRELATVMLIRLLETHEVAVDAIEATIPILMNKAFRSLSKISDKTKIFRISKLLSVLAEWFAPVLSRDNAVTKCMAFLLRETEVCARIVQHHWRGVLFERNLLRREYDPSVHARLRSMHFVKNVELRHQFKVLRDAMGAGGLPLDAVHAYVKILFHLVKPTATGIDSHQKHQATADQKRSVSSGSLVYLASLIPIGGRQLQDAITRRLITENVKATALELARCFQDEPDKIIAIMKCNLVERVMRDLHVQLNEPGGDAFACSSLDVAAAIASAVWRYWTRHERDTASRSTRSSSEALESAFLVRKLEQAASQFLATPLVMHTLLQVLPVARSRADAVMCEQVLSILRHLAGSFGFVPLLDALTSNGGRSLEQVLLCFEYDTAPVVVASAVALFYDMTNRADARAGFTTAGAALLLAKSCNMGIENAKNPSRFVLALTGIALLARQTRDAQGAAPASRLLDRLGSLEKRVEALYSVLLSLVDDADDAADCGDALKAALYLHEIKCFVPIVLRFLLQVKPTDMEPAFQTASQRNISCIVLGRFFEVQSVAVASFAEATVNHLALSLQCNRLDEVERRLSRSRSSERERRLHWLGSKEACKALSRLARCPTAGVNATLQPSLTSANVPELPQAVVCDVMIRLHVLEDALPMIHLPTDAAEFPEIERTSVRAAVELIGYMCPMPYGEDARERFFKTMHAHRHGQYAHEKLQMLVEIAAPMILRVLREKNCGKELVASCCASLSRLAATNACRSQLLAQGGLFIAITHLPDVLYDPEQARVHQYTRVASSPKKQVVNCDAMVDDHGLFDVPASLFTLVGKLAAIDEGRTAIMRAQVLPRMLKRLQLTDLHSSGADVDVKSEIAVVIQRLAMVNAVEGNTSELFLHFHVLDVLVQIFQDECRASSKGDSSPTRSNSGEKRDRQVQRHWRILDAVVGAIAALAQDVLVCVPQLVRLDIVTHLAPFLSAGNKSLTSNHNGRTCSGSGVAHHIESLQYHAMNVVRAVASYPFGEYHAHLTQVRVTPTKRAKDDDRSVNAVAAAPTLTLMERVKRLGYDFTLELQNRGAASSDRKTIGELARETLAFLNERQQQDERSYTRAQSLGRQSTTIATPEPTKPQQLQKFESPVKATSRRCEEDSRESSFPSLPRSPKPTKPGSTDGDRSESGDHRAEPRSTPLPPAVNATSIKAPESAPLLVPFAEKTPVNLLSTRPPGTGPCAAQSEAVKEAHHVFARPKATPTGQTKSRRHKNDEFAHALMLDPLFSSNNAASPTSSGDLRPRQMRLDSRRVDGDATASTFAFFHGADRYGHQVNVRARRNRSGDKYIPSIGQIHVDDPTMNVLR